MRRYLAAAVLFLAACADPTLPPGEWVRAGAGGEATLVITNRGDEPVYVQVSDPTELSILMGCSRETCTRIDPGKTVRVPYDQIQGYDLGDSQAAVNWWVFSDTGATRGTGTVIAEI
jgi:hypothetical protein